MLVLTSNVLRGQGQVSRRYSTILSLPDEVLYCVFRYLDCWGIVALRSTCGRLYVISKSHLLWQSKTLEVSYSSGVPLLDEPVENYTSEELEAKLLTRARASQKWHRKLDPAGFQWRKIEVGYVPWSFYELKWLPGGRWLLVNLKGCVSILDLDVPESIRVPLFDARDSADPLHRSAIWIDPTKCWLSPRIALHSRDTEKHKGSSRICVYQLNSTGRGLDVKWSAEEVATVRTLARGMKADLQLEKEYVLERCMYSNDNGSYSFKVYLHQYSDSRFRSCEWEPTPSSKTLLLPKSRIGVVTLTHIKLFTIKPVGSDGLELQPTFCTLVDPMPLRQEFKQLHSTLHCSYFSIACHNSMLEIQFPHDANEVYQKRTTFTHGPIPAIKSRSFLIRLLDDRSLDLISYRTDAHTMKQVASQNCISADAFRNKVLAITACDETSGRLITSKRYQHMLLQI